MTNAVQTNSAADGAPPVTGSETPSAAVPDSWREMRDNSAIQFDEVELKPPEVQEPSEPGWLSDALAALFEGLGEFLLPVGAFLGSYWYIIQWVLLALAVVFVLYMALRTFGPIAGRTRRKRTAVAEPEWKPDEAESIALLEDADKLAAEGRFDEATRLLLQRSVGQIAETRPDWVDPSSTARELVALPALSEAARSAFATISERVERSLFALRALNRDDWEAARSAYANFALAKIEGAKIENASPRPKNETGSQMRAV